MTHTTETHSPTTTPDDIRPKIPLQYSFPPKVRVDEKINGDWEKTYYGVGPSIREANRLPPDGAEALLKFTGVPSEIQNLNPAWIPGDASEYPEFGDSSPTVWMCQQCAERDDQYGDHGYLTQQKACKTTERRRPSCSHSWEEEAHTGLGLGLEWGAEEAWGAEITLNGDRSAPTAIPRDRELSISLYPEWDYTVDPVASTTVSLPETGTETITRTTAGKEWTATITVDDTVTVDWERDIPGGETLCGATGTELRERECDGSSFRAVYPEDRARDGNYLPLHEMDAAEFPNHPSHFGRMIGDPGFTADQMVDAVEEALWNQYHAFHA